jgi:putative ABC transport system substrate-binding protein
MPVVIAGLPIAAADAIAARRKARLLTGIASGDVHAGHVELIASIRPNAARVVVPHVRSDAAHQAMMRALVAAARTRPFTIEPYRIDEAGGGAAALPATLDPATSVVYLAAASAGDAADAVIEEAGRRGLPVVADRRDLVVRGATATLVHDSYSIGRQTGELAAAILHDASQARQPIHRAEARFLIVNGEAAADPRLKLAVDLAEVANEIIEWAQPDGPNPVVKPAPPPEGEVSSQ